MNALYTRNTNKINVAIIYFNKIHYKDEQNMEMIL